MGASAGCCLGETCCQPCPDRWDGHLSGHRGFSLRGAPSFNESVSTTERENPFIHIFHRPALHASPRIGGSNPAHSELETSSTQRPEPPTPVSEIPCNSRFAKNQPAGIKATASSTQCTDSKSKEMTASPCRGGSGPNPVFVRLFGNDRKRSVLGAITLGSVLESSCEKPGFKRSSSPEQVS
jgi:hypothetical protein